MPAVLLHASGSRYFFFLCLVLIVVMLSGPATAAEPVILKGKIVSITFEPFRPMKGSLEIKTFWGKRHIIYVGIKTRYQPQKNPEVGDKIIAECIRVKGNLAATRIRYQGKEPI